MTATVATAGGDGRRLTIAGVGAFLAVFLIGTWALAGQGIAIRWWTNAFWLIASGATAARCLLLARRRENPARRAWLLFGFACLAWFLGMLAWSYEELLLGKTTPFPAVSDFGFLLFAPLAAAALVYYRNRSPGLRLTLMELSQLGVLASTLVILHVLALHPRISAPELTATYVAVALAYPVLYMTLLIQALAMLWLHGQRPGRRVLALLVAGIAVHAVADSFYAYALLGQDYQTGQYLDITWLAGFALLFLAAAEQGLRIDLPNGEPDEGDGLSQMLRQTMVLPFLAMFAIVVLTYCLREQLTVGAFIAALPGAAGMVAFLALREWARESAQRKLNRTLHQSEQSFRKFFHASPVIVSITRLRDGRFMDVNDGFVRASGWQRREVIGRTSLEVNIWESPAARERMIARLRAAGGSLRDIEWRLRTRGGEMRDALGSVETVEHNGEPCLIIAGQDITERKRAIERTRMLSNALEQAADMVMITDRGGRIEYVNPAFCATTGFQPAELIGKRPNLIKSDKQGAEFYRKLWETIVAGDAFNEVFVNRRRDGSLYYEEKTISPLKDDTGEITHFVATGRDITERMQTQERLQFLAHHDALTRLPNRALFLDRLKQSLARARWHERPVAVMFLDIDRFKTINDTLGHDVGDRLLEELSVRLTGCLRERDTVARFGGDEFVILLDDIAAATDAGTLAKKILDALKAPFVIGPRTLHVSGSIGISLYPGDGEDSASLLKNADAAMYRAKDLGRDNYQFYSAEMSARSFERLTLENSLHHALARNEFELYYQPQRDARHGKTPGVEALLRWHHPDFGLVSPLEFVPLLEDTGLILPVGYWVLETACAQLAAWRRLGHTDLQMAVNLSARQFNRPDLVPRIERILGEHDLPPGALELEITENILMRPDAKTLQKLEALNVLGVRLAIDDFGTGYSSLGYLRHLPVDCLKIDRSFIRDVPENPDDVAITQAIVSMGQSLCLALVAEGVETEDQRDFLLSIGCERMQGYLFARPAPAGEILPLLGSPECRAPG
jgi:diguanylate cyclase (GGDEF)-like protein/PAS domain S-box-containing protein